MSSVSNIGSTPVWLNLGCGHNSSEHWDNFDRSPMIMLRRHMWVKKALQKAGVLSDEHIPAYPENVSRRDLVRPLPYEDRTVSAIYSSHMLEHMYFDDARRVLSECYRVCGEGAVLRLALPDTLLFARELVEAGDDEDGKAALHYNEMLRTYPNARPTGPRRVAFAGGSNWHKWQPTRGLVRSMLADAGFKEIKEFEYRVGTLPELDIVEVREDSMFFEARR
ncbi:MAG TPA: methyltransferase domain-containing protein [Acidimicrobiales bacterium]